MAKKNKPKAPSSAANKFLGWTILVVLFSAVAVKMTMTALYSSDYFRVRAVVTDTSLQFIDKNDLQGIKGKNIFSVDVVQLQRRLQLKYPQLNSLKILRKLPDQIWVTAKPRVPFAQALVRNHLVTIDDKGIIVALINRQDKSLPLIKGIKSAYDLSLGGTLSWTNDLKICLGLIKAYRSNVNLKSLPVVTVVFESPSKIEMVLANNISVILDSEALEQRLKMLVMVLADRGINLTQVKYIDLRFNEPVIGKR